MNQQAFKRIDHFYYDPSTPLGKGAFATVYKATDEETKTPVAFKVIPTSKLIEDEDHYNLFLREVNTLHDIKGEHIVQFLDVKRTSNNLYIITEYCDGGDLEKKIKDKYNFTEEEALRILKQIADAFITVDNLNLIKSGGKTASLMHRDIKPANILFHEGKIKVADFGFAKLIDKVEGNTKKEHTPWLGTPIYMAPEILNDEVYSAKCDIWSTGMVIYQILFGELAWTGKSIPGLYKAIQSKPLEFSGKEISEDTKDLLRKMLKIDEEERISWREVYNHPALVNINISEQKQKNPKKIDFWGIPDENAMSQAVFKKIGSESYMPNSSISNLRSYMKASMAGMKPQAWSMFIWVIIMTTVIIALSRMLGFTKPK